MNLQSMHTLSHCTGVGFKPFILSLHSAETLSSFSKLRIFLFEKQWDLWNMMSKPIVGLNFVPSICHRPLTF